MGKTEDGKIAVEVAYALPERQLIIPLQVEKGTTVEQTILQSGILGKFSGVELTPATKVGIFSKLTRMDTVLRDGDRVEIYRPLIADPKEVRKRRAAEGKKMKKGGG